jgi:hypothetical protein
MRTSCSLVRPRRIGSRGQGAPAWSWYAELEEWYRTPSRLRMEDWLVPLSSHAASARDLLERGEVLEPGLPDLESLRAVIALEQGDRERAVQLSRFLAHSPYFALFHDGTRIISP